MNIKLFIIGLFLAVTGSTCAASKKPQMKVVAKTVSAVSSADKGQGTSKREEALGLIRELDGADRLAALREYFKDTHPKLATDYLEYGLNGLRTDTNYTIAVLRKRLIGKGGIVDFDLWKTEMEATEDTTYNFDQTIDLICKYGHGDRTFLSAIERDNEVGGKLLLQKIGAENNDRERKENEASQMRINQHQVDSNAELQEIKIKADAEAQNIAIQAQAKENDIRIKAAAQAQKVKIKADAEAQDRATRAQIAARAQSTQDQKDIDDNRSTLNLDFWQKMLSSRTVLMIVGAIVVILFVRYWFPSLFVDTPELVIATNVKSAWSGDFGMFANKPKIKARKVLHAEERQASLAELDEQIKKAMDDSDFVIPNLIFYGPPGVGKTATAKKIIEDSGCLYVQIDGSKFFQWEEHEAVREVNKLIEMLKGQEKPVYLIIDEGEQLFGQRVLDKKLARILTPILAQFGGASGRTGFIIITNLYKELDYAVISRTAKSYIWNFKTPGPAECTNIAEYYLAFYADKFSLMFDFDLQDISVLEKIYKEMESLEGKIVGREIEAIVQQIAMKAKKVGDEKNETLKLGDVLSLLKKTKDK